MSFTLLTIALTLLFAIAAIGTGLSLLDSWLRGRKAYASVRRAKALLDAGFIPQAHAHEVNQQMRLRPPAKRSIAAVKRASRSAKRQMPVPMFEVA